MAKSVELQKLPVEAKKQAEKQGDSLPFSSVTISVERGQRPNTDFSGYLNHKEIFRMSRHERRSFDAAAEILKDSVYKPFIPKRK